MNEVMDKPKFRVEFNKVCEACSAECPYLTIQEFEVKYGYPETTKRRKCKNERICRDAAISEFQRLKKYLVKDFAPKTKDKVKDP